MELRQEMPTRNSVKTYVNAWLIPSARVVFARYAKKIVNPTINASKAGNAGERATDARYVFSESSSLNQCLTQVGVVCTTMNPMHGNAM
jgi:hypothetical protein